jgi:16S rRNA (uracil1498-N3)-methyltransferase
VALPASVAVAAAYTGRVNLLLVEPGEIDAGGDALLTGRRARHLAEVLRARVGDRLRAGVIRGGRGRAEVLELAPDRARLHLALDQPPSPAPPVELVLAVPRPKALARALETAAALGVARIDLVNAWRVDKAYFQSARLDREALRHDLVLGCEQGGSTWLPDIEVHRLLVPFLTEVLPPRLAGRRRLLAHPGAPPLETALRPGDPTPTVLAIGPDGGWIGKELDSFTALGFTPVSLGAGVLRTDAAVAALLAQLELLRRL